VGELAIELYSQTSGEKLHLNPATPQSCPNIENFNWKDDRWLKPQTNDLAIDT
jgi:hypothetical protein